MSGSGISWAICKSAPRSRQISTPAPHHSVFYRLDALPAAQPTVHQSTEGNSLINISEIFNPTVPQHSTRITTRFPPNLAGAESNDEVGNGCILRLATAVRHHHAPAGLLRHLARLDRLRHRADLVHFQQQAVARLLVNGHLHSLRVGHR